MLLFESLAEEPHPGSAGGEERQRGAWPLKAGCWKRGRLPRCHAERALPQPLPVVQQPDAGDPAGEAAPRLPLYSECVLQLLAACKAPQRQAFVLPKPGHGGTGWHQGLGTERRGVLGPGAGTEIAEVLCNGQGGSRLPPAVLRVNGELVWVQQSGADWPVGNSKVLVVQHQGPKTSFCANTMSRGWVTGQISSGSLAPGSQTLPAPPWRGSRIIRLLGRDGTGWDGCLMGSARGSWDPFSPAVALFSVPSCPHCSLSPWSLSLL